MKTFPTLYKRAKTGKIQQWEVFVEASSDDTSVITTTQGQLTGKKQKYQDIISEGKNIGKSNETTPFEQACNEAESKYKKKKDEGYKTLAELGIIHKGDNDRVYLEDEIQPLALDIALEKRLSKHNTDASGNIKPMLAQKFEDYKHKIVYPCAGQPKLNGVRCLAKLRIEKDDLFEIRKVSLTSRDGKEYTVDHIQKELLLIFDNACITGEDEDELTFDGELYCHGLPLNQIVSAVKKPNINTPKIEYHVYDMAIGSVVFDTRISALANIIANVKLNSIKLVQTLTINNEEEVYRTQADYIEEGYEGLMLRNWLGIYGFGQRSKDLLKVKSWQEEEFEITGAEVGSRGIEDMVFKLITKNGKEFDAKPKGTREEKQEYWSKLDSLIGKMATVKFFEYTEFGKPFHGHVTVIRDYE